MKNIFVVSLLFTLATSPAFAASTGYIVSEKSSEVIKVQTDDNSRTTFQLCESTADSANCTVIGRTEGYDSAQIDQAMHEFSIKFGERLASDAGVILASAGIGLLGGWTVGAIYVGTATSSMGWLAGAFGGVGLFVVGPATGVTLDATVKHLRPDLPLCEKSLLTRALAGNTLETNRSTLEVAGDLGKVLNSIQ